MKPNNIIYADLSTYTPTKSMAFYEGVFGWQFRKSGGYYTAHLHNQVVGGLYETPEKFKQMRMPHFWMTYIEVDNVSECVEKARSLNGIIETEAQYPGFGNIALIRDPSGAGFTVYDGNMLLPSRTKDQINTLTWNELHVSDVETVIPFYQGIFDWNFERYTSDHYGIRNGQDHLISDVVQIPNTLKGKFEYWICTFGVADVQSTRESILNLGGSLIQDEGNRMLMTDDSKEAFFYIQGVRL